MRIRYLKNTDEILDSSPNVVQEPQTLKGKWRQAFAPAPEAGGEQSLPLSVEVGCGKGKFICGMAKAHPGEYFIGVETVATVLARAARKVALLAQESPEDARRIRLIHADAQTLSDLFASGEVDHLYLNFSDPWPRAKHAKRRLTSWRFLPIYATILKEGGDLRFKTDNAGLFAFSVESFERCGWQVVEQTDDLHHSPYVAGNVTTEYEENFLMNDKPIYYLRAVPRSEEARKKQPEPEKSAPAAPPA